MDVTKLYKEKHYPVKGSNKTIFFFPAGLTKMWQYKLTIAQINKMDISVIGYDIQWKKSIGSMNVDDSIAFVKSVGESSAAIFLKHQKRATAFLAPAMVPFWHSMLRNSSCKSIRLS